MGVVHDYTYYNPQMTAQDPVLFLPLSQEYSSLMFVAIRTRIPESKGCNVLRREVGELDSKLPIENVETLDRVRGNT